MKENRKKNLPMPHFHSIKLSSMMPLKVEPSTYLGLYLRAYDANHSFTICDTLLMLIDYSIPIHYSIHENILSLTIDDPIHDSCLNHCL